MTRKVPHPLACGIGKLSGLDIGVGVRLYKGSDKGEAKWGTERWREGLMVTVCQRCGGCGWRPHSLGPRRKARVKETGTRPTRSGVGFGPKESSTKLRKKERRTFQSDSKRSSGNVEM